MGYKEKRQNNKGVGGLDALTNPFTFAGRFGAGAVTSVDDILRGLGRMVGAVGSDYLMEPVRTLIPGGDKGYFDPEAKSAVAEDIIKPIGKSFANTADVLGDLTYLGNAFAKDKGRANVEFGERLQELNDDPFNFLLEHVGNVAIVGGLAAKPAQLGMAASRGAIPASQVARGLRPLKGRGTRATARGATQQAASEGSTLARGIMFTDDIVAHPYRTAARKIGQSRLATLIKDPRAFDPVTKVTETVDNVGMMGEQGRPLPEPWRGTPYERTTENVPIEFLDELKEFDRTGSTHRPAEYLENLRQSMETEGIREPLIVDVDPATGRAILTEGNHRLAIAKEMGLTELPVRVMRGKVEEGRGAPVDVAIQPNEHGYVPGDMTPSQAFGESVVARRQPVPEPTAPSVVQPTEVPPRLTGSQRAAQSAGYLLEDIKGSSAFQSILGVEAKVSRKIRDELREGRLMGTGRMAETVKNKVLGQEAAVGNVNVRRKWDPSRVERLFLRDLKNLGKRKDASRWGGLLNDIEIDRVTPRDAPGRIAEVAGGKRVVGQTLDPEGLLTRITRVVEEAQRQAGGGPTDQILKEMLPGVDPMGLYLLGLNALEKAQGLPENTLTAALGDYVSMDRFADVNRRAQRALGEANDVTDPRFRIPEDELSVDLDALPPEARTLFQGAAQQYARELAETREPLLVGEELIPAAGTRIGLDPNEPTRFPTELEDMPLTKEYRDRLHAARNDADAQRKVVGDLQERLNELRESGRPTMRRDVDEGVKYQNRSTLTPEQRHYNKLVDEYEKLTTKRQAEQVPTTPRVKNGTEFWDAVVPIAVLPDAVPTGGARYSSVRDSIEGRGFDKGQPIRLRREADGRVTIDDGHHRLAAARELGIEEVPVSVYQEPGLGRPEFIPESRPKGNTLGEIQAIGAKLGEVVEARQRAADAGNPLAGLDETSGRPVFSKYDEVTRREPTKASMERTFKKTQTGKAIDRLGKHLAKERVKLAQVATRLEDLEAMARIDPANAPASARNLMVYANQTAPAQAAKLRELADSGVGNPEVYRALADELDAMPKTLEDLNSADVYLAYLKDIKDSKPQGMELGPGPSASRPLSTRKPGGTRRRGTQTDIDYSRDFRARAYWQEAEFQSWFLARQADEFVHTHGLAKTGATRLKESGFSADDIANMTEGQAQQALERLGLKAYQPDQLFGTARKPTSGKPLEAEWITPFAEQNLMGALDKPGWIERHVFEGLYDPATRIWKVFALPLRLAWQVNNFAGGALLSMLAGQVNPFDYPALMKASWNAVHDWNRGITSQIKVPLTDVYRQELVKALGTADEAQRTVIQNMLDQDSITLSNEVLNDISSSGITRGDFAWLNNSQFLRDIGANANQNILQQFNVELPKVPGKVGERARNLRQTGREVVDLAYHVNEMVDNLHRTMVYLDQLGKGGNHTQAMGQVVKALGDYSKLSGFERRVIKRIYPFYPWMRHVTEVVTNSLAPDNITRTLIFTHLTNVLGEPNEWEEMLPEWAGGHIFMGLDENGKPKFLSTRGLNPFLDVFDPLAQPNMRGLVRPLNPFLQMFEEQRTGVSTLTGRPFSSPGQAFGGSEELPRPPMSEYLFRNIPQLGAARDVYRDLMGQPLTRYGTGEPAFFPGAEEGRSSLQDVQQLFGYNVRPLDVESMDQRKKMQEYREQVAKAKYEQERQARGGRSASDLLSLLPGIG